VSVDALCTESLISDSDLPMIRPRGGDLFLFGGRRIGQGFENSRPVIVMKESGMKGPPSFGLSMRDRKVDVRAQADTCFAILADPLR